MRVITLQIKNQEKICGGAYQKYMELIDGFLCRGWEVHHISPRRFSNIKHKNLIHHEFFDISIVPSFISVFIQTFIIMACFRQKRNMDAVVTFSPLEGLIGTIFKIFSKKTKLIVAFHSDSISGIELGMKNTIKKNIYKKILQTIEASVIKKSDLVIFVSEYDREHILKRYKIENISATKVIYNNINTPRIKELNKEFALNVRKYKKVIGFVGNLHENGKGLKYLLESFYNVKQILPNSTLVIVGIGPDLQKLKTLTSRLNLDNDVVFLGFQENPLRYMKSFNLMVLPSLHEAFPLVILEALYIKIPVIASNVGGIPEILKYDKLMFESKNVSELTAKILLLLQDEKEYKQALELCEERRKKFIFDWQERMVNEIKNICRLNQYLEI
jgi:glycosyltransferase involved in cell wall biosynthesis